MNEFIYIGIIIYHGSKKLHRNQYNNYICLYKHNNHIELKYDPSAGHMDCSMRLKSIYECILSMDLDLFQDLQIKIRKPMKLSLSLICQ